MAESVDVLIRLRNSTEHYPQQRFIQSTYKRIIIRAGRRGGKTVGMAQKAIHAFLKGRRVLYAAPTGEQTDAFWFEVKRALRGAVEAGAFKLNEQERWIEKVGTQQRIKAKTAWNADTLRGDFADLLIFDEWQLTAEDAWDVVGEPMLLDNNGDAVFIYTPPSLKSSGINRAKDPRHASKMFKAVRNDTTGLWETIHFTSHDNPFLSKAGLEIITENMSRDSYLKEIMAQDDDEEANLLVYGCFNEDICKVKRFVIPEDWPVYSGHDFGTANPAALFAAQEPNTGFFYLFKEYVPPKGYSTYQNIQNFHRSIVIPGEEGKEDPKTYDVKGRVGGSPQEDEIRQGYSSQGWPIVAPFVTRVLNQVDRVKQLMEKNQIFIFEDLHVTLGQINSCLFKLDDFGQKTNEIKDEKKFHTLACMRYLFSLFRPIQERIPQKEVAKCYIPGASRRNPNLPSLRKAHHN